MHEVTWCKDDEEYAELNSVCSIQKLSNSGGTHKHHMDQTKHSFLEVSGLWSLTYSTFVLGKKKRQSVSHSVGSHSLGPHGLQPTRLPSFMDSPGKDIGVCSYSLFQGIFLTQGLNLGCYLITKLYIKKVILIIQVHVPCTQWSQTNWNVRV